MVRARLFTVARILLAVGLTAAIVLRSHPGEIGDSLAGAAWSWVAAALVLVALDRSLMAYRWVALLAPLDAGRRPPFASILRIFFVSTFVGTFLPAGVGGDAVRTVSLARAGVRAAQSLASVLMDRLLGVLGMLLTALAGLALAPAFLSNRAVDWSIALTTAGCAAALALVFSTRVDDAVRRWVVHRSPSRLRAAAEALLDALQAYRGRHGMLAGVLVMSAGVQVLRVCQAWMLGRALHIDTALVSYVAPVPLIVLIMQMPITISGLGTGNVAFVWFFGRLGVPAAQAVALSVLFVALGPVGNLPGGLIYALGPRKAKSP
jgi:glycosyltransferase 2 family protein